MKRDGHPGWNEEHEDEFTDEEMEEEDEQPKDEVPEEEQGMRVGGEQGVQDILGMELTLEQLQALAKKHGVSIVRPPLPAVDSTAESK